MIGVKTMFGLVSASLDELTKEERDRYSAVYCGICRRIGEQDGQACRLGLSYDMAFLALLHMSLYEPEEQQGASFCVRHPVKRHPWTDNEMIRYAARMNVALACYNARDDWQDEKNPSAWVLSKVFGRNLEDIQKQYPRQCAAIESALAELSALEQAGCSNPDEPANAFGRLLGELMVYKEDLWAEQLYRLGFCLGRFIYLADAIMDYDQDKKHVKYNPYVAMGGEEDQQAWEQHLVLAMAGCTDAYERLPLVQDKGLLDNILYSGVWLNYRAKQRKSREEDQNGGPL